MRKIYIVMMVAALYCSSIAAAAQNETDGKGIWLDVSLGTGDYAALPEAHTMCTADVAIGYRVNPHFAIGGGAGAILGIKTNAWNIPAFIRMRYDILDRFATPFITVDLGYAFTTQKQDLAKTSPSPTTPARYIVGPYDNITVGCAFKIEKGHRIWLGVSGGYYLTGIKQTDCIKRDMDLFAGMLRIGYCF